MGRWFLVVNVHTGPYTRQASAKEYRKIVNNLTVEGFIAALDRFLDNRGHYNYIFSGKVTNFAGAKECISRGIDFHFIQARSSRLNLQNI